MKLNLKTILILLFASIIYTSYGCTKERKAGENNRTKEIYDILYYNGTDSDDIKHRLNLFLPEGVENPPLMLWIHGGAWAFGGRKFETNLARKFARQGIAVAVISYRLSPGTWKNPAWDTGIQHPEHIKDVARAFAWVHTNADIYKYDKHSIFVSGYSAGGHLSALLAMDPTYLTDVGKSVKDIKGVIPIAGAYDIESYYDSHLKYNGVNLADSHVKAVFGDTKEDFRNASPTSYTKYQWVPMLVISESESYDYTLLLEKAAKRSKYDKMQFYHVRDKTHAELYEDLSNAESSIHRDKIIEYIHKNKVDYTYLDKEGFRLAYKIFGQGEPLFLLNGGPGYSSHHFTNLAENLGNKNTVILFDQRGTGYSFMRKKNSSNITLDLMVEDLEDLRKHLGYTKISLMGHSFGGIYAMSYAAVYPNNIDKMILSHSGGMNMDFMIDVDSRIMSRLNEQERQALNTISYESNPDIRSMIRAESISPGYVFERKHKNIVFQGLAFNSRFYRGTHRLVFQNMRGINYDVRNNMQQFDKPVLIIHGDHDVVNPNTARSMHDLFPKSKLVILENCAHYGWIERPNKYFEEIDAFLSNSRNSN